jgi:uncharacterized protein (DUF2147 family)
VQRSKKFSSNQVSKISIQMKYSIFLLALIFSFSTVFAQTSQPPTAKKSSTQQVTPSTQKTTPQKQPTNTVTPSNQKNSVTPVKPSVIPPKATPATTPKDITGYWLTANKATIIQFYKAGDVYQGKIVWTRNKDKNGKPLTDVNNPDKAKRKNQIVGTQMVSNLKYNAKTKYYEGGKAYLPQTGKTYNCKARLIKSGDAMEVTAMAGMSLMSKTLTWTRTTGVPSK